MRLIVTFETESKLHVDTGDLETIEELRNYLFENNTDENMKLLSVNPAQQQENKEQAENVSQQTIPGSEASTQISAIINYIDSSRNTGLSNFHILSHVYGTLQKLLVL